MQFDESGAGLCRCGRDRSNVQGISMRPESIFNRLTFFAAVIFGLPASASACATCGCSLSTDAAAGYSAESGWRLNLEYDFIDQNELRAGTSEISEPDVARINNAGGAQEVEHRTTNRYTTLSIGYTPVADWNFRLVVPYIDRTHSTFGNSSNPLMQGDLSGSSLTGLGDVRFVTSWQGLLPTHNLGLQLGVKLPTGNYGGGPTANGTVVGRSPTDFSSGPAQGSPVDTSLQPGTGSTDVILGAFYYQPISQNFDAFVNGQFQSAFAEKLDQAGADYRPGNSETISAGLRYEADPMIVPQIQLNLIKKSHDQGYLADVTDTAGLVAYLSPGVTVHAVGNLFVYGFVQLPVWSNLSGYQLFPHWTASVGASYAF
jgi:hypothetical protein